jgi:hypothetical protein
MLQICRDRYELIFDFTIYGERHSGTNFLERCIKQKFGLNLTYFFGFKHFFGWMKPEKITYSRNTLFIGIVRNPYDWLLSFYNAPHHVPKENKHDIKKFLTNEWYSIDYHKKEILTDRNFFAKPFNPTRPSEIYSLSPRYKNIFELRRNKCVYLSQMMPMIASNYILISYDMFIKNHQTYLNIIGNRFAFKSIGEPPNLEKKSSYGITAEISDIINNNIDW